MANLRRHFNFNTKPSVSQEAFSVSSCKTVFNNFDKLTLMNDICNCLDLCCSYIQALNSLCSAGSSLAKSLFYTVREAPAYHNVSLQFLSVWEEVSKATAGASAAVKTETLMLLQEILNSLEMSSNETNTNDIILGSFQAVGSCLCSFIELQAQFSWSTWKSLSKLSKSFTNESLKHSLSLQWKSLDKNPSKIFINSDLNSTIKKHYSQFCKVGVPKFIESSRPCEKQFSDQFVTSVPSKTRVSYSFTSGKSSHCSTSESMWANSPTTWSSKNSGIPSETDLDEVINLLSCVPVQQFANNLRNKNLINYPVNNEQLSNISEDTVSSISGQIPNQSVWPKDTDNMKSDLLYWRIKGNSSNISINSDINVSQTYENSDFYKQWESKENQMWNASSTETGSSSDDVSSHCFDELNPENGKYFDDKLRRMHKKGYNGESMPGGLENVSEYGEEHVMELQSKINTWPLKQSVNQNF